MEVETWNPKVLGLVFDISLRHDNGQRIIDLVKKSFVEYIRAIFDDDDILYLYHPEIVEPVVTHGEQVSVIGNYQTDGWKFDLSYALKQSLYVIGNEDDHYEKILLLVTDRLEKSDPLRQVATINNTDMIDAKLICLGIGNRYNSGIIPESWLHIAATPSGVFSSLKESVFYGKK